MRQILYHLIFSVIQLSATGSVVRIHVSYKDNTLNITVWVSHPWLGDGITEVDPCFRVNTTLLDLTDSVPGYNTYSENQESAELPVLHENEKNFRVANSGSRSISSSLDLAKAQNNLSRESLGLLLSCQLAELHGGEISIQGSPESGYRYVLSLPLHLGTVDAVSDV